MVGDCAVRGELARASLNIADEESRDADVLKQAALNGMALDHKGRPGAPAVKIGCPATGPHVPWQMRGFANRAVRPRPVERFYLPARSAPDRVDR
jgi:hypothetical protein